jgi:hypothetical protein
MKGKFVTPRETVEKILMGGISNRIPFTMYESKLPRCALERMMRNRGLCIVQRNVSVYKTYTPDVQVSEHTYIEDGKKLVRTEYRTPVGILYTITEKADFTTWTHKKLFTGPDDYKSLLFLIKNMRFEPDYDAFSYAEQVDGGDSFFRPYLSLEPMQWLISEYMGADVFSMEWFDNRDELLKLYNALVDNCRQLYPICAASPALAFNYGGNVTPEILGLERFEKYYVPNYNEAAEVLHKKGKLVGVHFDANCKLISNAIAQTKLDYIEAFTPSPGTDMTLAEARAAWPDKILWINFPSAVHLDTVEEVSLVTENLLAQIGSPEKFIMGITEDIPENRWRETIPAILDVLWKD